MNGPAMIEKKRFRCQETMCVLPGMNLICLYIRVNSRFEFQVGHSCLKYYIGLRRCEKTFKLTNPALMNPEFLGCNFSGKLHWHFLVYLSQKLLQGVPG